MHQPQPQHTALPSTFLALLLTTLTLAMSTSTSTTKTVLVFLACLAASLAAAQYIVSPAESNADGVKGGKDAIWRGVESEGFRERKQKSGEMGADVGDERVKKRAERKREKEVRAALQREFWPTRGELLGGSRDGREEIEMGGEEEENRV